MKERSRTMYGQNTTNYQDWTAEEWASENPTTESDAMAHWTKDEYVGDRGNGRSAHVAASDMLEGERGLSGFRHTAPASHWAPAH
jgi:hypothetical protein